MAFADAQGMPCYLTGSTDEGVLRIIYFPSGARPALAKSGTIEAIGIDGQVESFSWATAGVTTQAEMLQSLTEQFGKPTSFHKTKHGRDEYYTVMWLRPNYRVSFRTGALGPGFGYVEIATPKGHARNERLQRKLRETKSPS